MSSTKNQTTTEEVREAFAQSYRWPDGSLNRGARKSALIAFNRWLDAYTAEVRNQVADEIDAEYQRRYRDYDIPDSHTEGVLDALDIAEQIARTTKENQS